MKEFIPCRECGEDDRRNFYRSKTSYWMRLCKKCCNRRSADHKRKKTMRRREELARLYGPGCLACGYDKHITMMTPHHMDPSTKHPDLKARSTGEGRWGGPKKGIFEMNQTDWDKEKFLVVPLDERCHTEIHKGLMDEQDELRIWAVFNMVRRDHELLEIPIVDLV